MTMWRLLIDPARVELSKREARFAMMTADLARARAAAGQLPAYERDVHALELALRQTTAGFHGVDDNDPDAVLRDLHGVAAESALNLLGVTPKPIVTRPQYLERPVELVLEGGYHGLQRFLDRLAAAPRLMAVQTVDIKTSVRPGSRSNLQVTLLISTVVLATDTPSSPPATADRPSGPKTGGAAIARAQQLPLGTLVGGSATPSGYDGGGRDPFVSLLTARKDSSVSKPKTAGSLTEVSVMAVSVKGILGSARPSSRSWKVLEAGRSSLA